MGESRQQTLLLMPLNLFSFYPIMKNKSAYDDANSNSDKHTPK